MFQIKFKTCKRQASRFLPDITDTIAFQNHIEEHLSRQISDTYDDPNAMWVSLKETIRQTIIDTQSVSRDLKRSWINAVTIAEVKARKDLKASHINTEHKYKEYNRLTRRIQTLCRRDKNLYIQKICKELEAHSEYNNSKDLFQKVRLLTRKFKAKNWAIKDSDGVIKTEIDQVIKVWRQYCERLFESDQTSQTNHEDCWTQPYKRDPTILISEVRAAIYKLKSVKAAGDELSLQKHLNSLERKRLRLFTRYVKISGKPASGLMTGECLFLFHYTKKVQQMSVITIRY